MIVQHVSIISDRKDKESFEISLRDDKNELKIISLEQFCKEFINYKIIKDEVLTPILDYVTSQYCYGFHYIVSAFIRTYIEYGNFTLNGNVAVFEDYGDFLFDTGEFVELRNGKILYKNITDYRGYKIKYDKNGINFFSIWQNTTNLEDRITSLTKCKKIINEWKYNK